MVGVDDFDGEIARLGVIEECAADQLLEMIGRLVGERLVIGRTVNADVPATVANESQESLAFRVRHRRIGHVIGHDVVFGEVGEPGAVGRSLDSDAVGPEERPQERVFLVEPMEVERVLADDESTDVHCIGHRAPPCRVVA